MSTQKVKAIRSLPGRARIGEEIEMDSGEARLQILAGKVIPANDGPAEKLENKAITKGMKRGRGD